MLRKSILLRKPQAVTFSIRFPTPFTHLTLYLQRSASHHQSIDPLKHTRTSQARGMRPLRRNPHDARTYRPESHIRESRSPISGTGQRDVGFERQRERLLVMKKANKSRNDMFCVAESRWADRDHIMWASLGGVPRAWFYQRVWIHSMANSTRNICYAHGSNHAGVTTT